jgi:hypothetical protein
MRRYEHPLIVPSVYRTPWTSLAQHVGDGLVVQSTTVLIGDSIPISTGRSHISSTASSSQSSPLLFDNADIYRKYWR